MRRNLFILSLALFITFVTFSLAQATNFTGLVTTKTKKSDGSWKTEPLADVEVIVGKNIWLETTPAGDFVRNAKAIVAKVKTDAKGEFKLNLPPGQYTIILWKRGYVPVFGPVSVPGTYKNDLSHRTSVNVYSHTSLGFKDN